MDGKLNKWWSVRVDDNAYELIMKLPWEKRKAMNRKIRELIEKETQTSTDPDLMAARVS